MAKSILILLHGGPGMDYSQKLFESFQNKDIKSITYTHGQNGKTIEAFVEELDNIVKSYPKHEIYLLGHSFGGCLALEYMDKHPKNIKKACVLNAPLSRDWADEWAKAYPNYKEKELTEISQSLKPDDQFKMISSIYGDLYFSNYEESERNFLLNGVKYNMETYTAMEEYVSTADYTKIISNLRIPTFFIYSNNDQVVLKDPVERVLKHMNSDICEKIFIDNVGHFPFIETPRKVNELVFNFLKRR